MLRCAENINNHGYIWFTTSYRKLSSQDSQNGGASEFSRQFNHSYHEKGQKEEDDGVAEGIAHAVVEELHTGFGPEEPRGYVEGPVGEAEDETREREDTCDDVHVRLYPEGDGQDNIV